MQARVTFQIRANRENYRARSCSAGASCATASAQGISCGSSGLAGIDLLCAGGGSGSDALNGANGSDRLAQD
jgi:hypothetical protein